MKKKIIWIIVALVVVAIIAAYFLAPLSDWKKGVLYNVGADKIAYSPQSSTYIMYCAIWWKCKLLKETQVTNEDFTYNGGNLPEIVITPSKA